MAEWFEWTIDASLIAKLEKAVKHVRLDWLAANSALVDRFQQEIVQQTSENVPCSSSHQRSDMYKYNRKEELDKLFEKGRDSEALRDSNVRHFLINRILDEFRPNIRRLSAVPIQRTIDTFCVNQSKEIEQHVLEVYDFVMCCVEQRPPLDADCRWFWICIITSDVHADQNDDGQVRDNVRKFVDKCCTIFRNDVRSDDYKQFLLTLLEYDFAATVARQRHRIESLADTGGGGDAANDDNSVKTTPRGKGTAAVHASPCPSSASLSSAAAAAHKRNVPLNSVTDLDNFPLVYLLLCRVHVESAHFSEHPNNKLVALALDFLMKYNPANPEQHIRTSRLYARLVGLLLDALLFVDLGTDPYHQITNESQLSDKVRSLLRKVRKQNNEWEWSIFVDLACVPWIKEYANEKDSPRKLIKKSLS